MTFCTEHLVFAAVLLICQGSKPPEPRNAAPRSLPPGLGALSGKVWTEDNRRAVSCSLPRILHQSMSLVEVCRAAMSPR